MTTISTFNDKPTTEDFFNIEQYTQGLTQFIQQCATPLTISIQGDWGTGKTSMMNRIQGKLEEDKSKKIKTIFFNTWQYSQFNMDKQLAFSLMKDLIRELNGKQGSDIVSGLKKSFSTLLSYVDAPMVNMEKVSDTMENFLLADHDTVKHLKEDFQKLIDATVKKESLDKIVIFIDDLDRLVPSQAVELLEVMKLFLDCEHCVFVLAVDYSVILTGVNKKYGQDIDESKGRAFFEKLIQVPFTIPVARYDIVPFIKDSLTRLNMTGFNDTDIQLIEKIIRTSIGYNPRGMNRLFNSLSLLLCVTPDGKVGENNQKILLLLQTCLQYKFEYVYDFMVINSGEVSEIVDFLNDLPREEDKNWTEQIQQEFLEFLPVFREVLGLTGKQIIKEADLSDFMQQLEISNILSGDRVQKQKQNHKENPAVQRMIQKIIAYYTGRDDVKPNEVVEIRQPYKDLFAFNKIRRTRGKGQGIYFLEDADTKNKGFAYTSGDTHGWMLNDGFGLSSKERRDQKLEPTGYDPRILKKTRVEELADEEVFAAFMEQFTESLRAMSKVYREWFPEEEK